MPHPLRASIWLVVIATIAGVVSACGSGSNGATATDRSVAVSVSEPGSASTSIEPPAPASVLPASPAAVAPLAQSPYATTSSTASAGSALPVSGATGNATEVITALASSTSSTTATLQAWDKVAGGWQRHGGAVVAHLGSAGLTAHASESLSATPIGSFALSRSFGKLANPGTGLPYHQTSPADWWISQPGALYNTMQTCTSACAFTQGDPNEHLYYETPYYNYAVVIEYNTASVVQGAGSAFFLHVTDGKPTAGCVSIPQANLVAIMQWLNPAASPRILIGVS
jgi:L,D-peptidoglycan transpeptidase YkuD (ErfK/YbiS/YcfS/YnhG family)